MVSGVTSTQKKSVLSSARLHHLRTTPPFLFSRQRSGANV